jgi:regulator of replication initiation timing
MRTIEVERLTRSLKDTMRQRDEAADEIERLRAENERLRKALGGVIRIADRDCPEFREARAALAAKEEE